MAVTHELAPAAQAMVLVAPPAVQPLWRFALVGLGPLSTLFVIALVVELAHRLA